MYTDIYLSFKDEAAAKEVLYRIEGAQEATDTTPAVEGYEVPNYANIDTVGVIYKLTGETDADGNAVMKAIPGWHVNVRLVDGEDGAKLKSFEVTPKTPVRVWA